MNSIEHLRRALIATLLVPLLLVGCGDDDPTGPGGGGGNDAIELSMAVLDYGTRFANADYTSFFEVEATGSEAFVGMVSVAEGAAFRLLDGDREIRIEPGETASIGVTWSAPSAGNVSTGSVAVGDQSLDLRGFASELPYFSVTPTALSEVDIRTNYRPFDDGGISVNYGTGRGHGEFPSWLSCRSGGKWTFNGQGLAESTVSFTFPGTSSVDGVRVQMSMEVEGDCTQVLVEVDGSENAYEDLEGCPSFNKLFSLSGGGHTIGIGTDQQGLCGDDLYVDNIRITVTGFLVPEADYVR